MAPRDASTHSLAQRTQCSVGSMGESGKNNSNLFFQVFISINIHSSRNLLTVGSDRYRTEVLLVSCSVRQVTEKNKKNIKQTMLPVKTFFSKGRPAVWANWDQSSLWEWSCTASSVRLCPVVLATVTVAAVPAAVMPLYTSSHHGK